MTYFLITLLPFVVLFVLLIGFRRPACEAAPIAYLVTLVIALGVWKVSWSVIGASLLDALVVFIEVMLIVTVALLVLNLMIEVGALETIKTTMSRVTSDNRVMAMLLAWGLVGFIEGIAGFGTPAVLAAPVLVHFGFSPIKAVTVSLIGNSTAVPFGAAGTPVVIGLSGLGNMISLSNIAMAAGAVGLSANEGKVIRKTIIPALVVCLTAGLLVFCL